MLSFLPEETTMRTLLLTLFTALTLFVATDAMACQDCDEFFVWPQLDWCAYCYPANCGSVLCTINSGEWCETEGAGCNDGGRGCPDIYDDPPPSYPIADLQQLKPRPAYRLTRVRITKARGAAVPQASRDQRKS